MSNPVDGSSPGLSPVDRLLREPLDRLLGRMAVEERRAISIRWADRAVRVHAPAVLETTGFPTHARTLRGLPQTDGEPAARALRDAAVKVFNAVDYVRVQREAENPNVDDPNSPAARACRVMSIATESAKACLGEAGLRVRTVTGNGVVAVQPQQVKVGSPDTGVQDAVLAARHCVNAAKCHAEAAAAAEESLQKQEIVGVLQVPQE